MSENQEYLEVHTLECLHLAAKASNTLKVVKHLASRCKKSKKSLQDRIARILIKINPY
jgi:hypothetical protein